MKPSLENIRPGSLKIKITVILGYLLVVAVMALGLFALYHNIVDYSSKRIKSENMSELLIVGNTLSLLYEIESQQNLVNAESAQQYFHKYDSIVPKIKENLDALKELSADSSRVVKLDTIQELVDLKKENLQEIAVLLDSIERAPRIVTQTNSSYVPRKLNKEIADYLEGKKLNNTKVNKNDTSVVVGNKRGLLSRVKDVFVARSDSTLVIEKKSIPSGDEFKLIIDTIVHKVRYSERIDLQRQREFQLAYLVRQEMMGQTNRMLTSRIDELLKGIENEELEKSLQLIVEKEQTISNSQRTMFVAFCVALFVAFVFALLFLVDINKSQRYKKRLEESSKRIADLLVSREKLMLAISHDIKAPMSSILGFIELMDTHGDRKNEAFLSNMKSSGEHILELASALLDYHKLEDGSWQMKESNFNLHKLVDDTASGFEPLAMRKGLEYVVNNELPEKLNVYSDSYMIRRIMNNLISNAIKYTPQGSVTVETKLVEEESLTYLRFIVTDTGEGIADEHQQIIFRKFTQLKNSLGEEGSGLGLAITNGFIEALNGTISLVSRQHEGAQFIVEIPLKSSPMKEKLQEKSREDGALRNLKGISALLVDDDPVQLTMTSEMLGRQNIKSVTEINPDKVLPLLESTVFDILFMDIQMPGTDGIELVGKVRRSSIDRLKSMPVIGLSARSEMSEEMIKSAGFTDFLAKPFTSDQLYDKIFKYVKGVHLENRPMPDKKKTLSEEKGVYALIEFVSDDVDASSAILQSFIDETGSSRIQLHEMFDKEDHETARKIAHKILPLFRLIGNEELKSLLERLEKGLLLDDNEKSLVLNKIETYLSEAEVVRRKISEG